MTAAALFSASGEPGDKQASYSLARQRHFWLPAAAVLLAAVAPAVQAEAGNPLNDRFSISLGGFLLDTDTEIARGRRTTPAPRSMRDGTSACRTPTGFASMPTGA